MKKQKIIVTGSEGLLGKQISNYLAKKFQVYLEILMFTKL